MNVEIRLVVIIALAIFMGSVKAAEMKYQSTHQPVVAVIALNEGTEITDFFVPLAMLANVTKTVSVSVDEGMVNFWPSLNAKMQFDIASFNTEFPQGADIVIVPAVHDAENQKLSDWLFLQAQQGALIVSICDGALVLANAGLLANKKATAHFYSLDKLEKQYPATSWVRNARFVHDENIVSTTGVSASFPASLYLAELIAGPSVAQELAETYHLYGATKNHSTGQFRVGLGEYRVGLTNMLKGLFNSRYYFELAQGMDEVGFAIYLDAFSRTYRSKVLTVSEAPITTANGVQIFPDLKINPKPSQTIKYEDDKQFIVDEVLQKISNRFGVDTASLVALQLEYDWLR